MQKKRLLQDIGLTAYEAAAYLSLLKFGVCGANIICRDADVPYGKIYTVLESLAGKGFIEVQVSRPKKFRAIDPEMALSSFFERRKVEIEREISVLENSVREAKQILKNVPIQKQKDEIFWTTAVTESEIRKFAISVYGEVKQSVCLIPPTFAMPIVSSLLPEILKAIDRGIKIRLLISPRFTALSSLLSRQGEEKFDKFKKGMEIRLAESFNSCFGIIDENVVVLFQLHPHDSDRILSVVKIWDTGLAKNLGKEFELLWNGGVEFDLEKLSKDEFSSFRNR
ncbi:TrmB family transcriptional regulator [Methanosarcina sp. MSH10X1]|uniref:TrmB family transcriptional regulator n=1 Tax=Methanosarcina sp. MSH10X1 TaxID=2507075 RepID=UPI000FFC0CC7|nr:helix-turn-helix domain-containing protein [Methanosarcina sp. MSH10X1]RXA20774.1 TrmB family transcriptional regulator [Methanosarcina sp. MSH10X1]